MNDSENFVGFITNEGDVFSGNMTFDGVIGPQGKSIEYVWQGTSLGIRLEGDSTYQFVDLQGSQGIPGERGLPGKDRTYGKRPDKKAILEMELTRLKRPKLKV